MTPATVGAGVGSAALSSVARALASWRMALVAVWGGRLGLMASAGAAGGMAAWWVLVRLAFDGVPSWAGWGTGLALALGCAVALRASVRGWALRGATGGWMGGWRPRPGVVDTAVWVETGVLPWERGNRSAATRAALEGASYALITCAEAIDAAAGGGEAPAVETRVVREGAPLLADRALRRRLWQQGRRWLLAPAGGVVVALAVVWGVRGPLIGGAPAGGAPVAGPFTGARGAIPPLGRWQITVQPPEYTRLPTRHLGDTNTASVIAGSVVELRGDGPVPEAAWRRGDGDTVAPPPVEAAPVAGGWRVRVVAHARPLALGVERGGTTRLLVVEGVADSLPVVTLEAPQRDTVVAAPTGVWPLRARVRDDLGVRGAHFEVIVSAGEGERFSATVRRVGARDGGNARALTLAGALELGGLGLNPGDVVHLRAVARDGHPRVGREAGHSETRRLRVARRGERDSLAVEGAPPPPMDTSLVSQRMLLRLATALARRRAQLAPAVMRSESGQLAREQARLRRTVGDVVFQRLGGVADGEHTHSAGDGHDHGVELVENRLALAEGTDGPVVAVNRPLLEAYNHMWDAGRALEVGEPEGALAPMRRALAAIERARAAERVYLRGRPPTVIVDVARVRLAGRDTGHSVPRPPRAPLPDVAVRRAARLVAAARLAATDAAAARDSVRLLRLEVLGDAPVLADALESVARALGAPAADSVVTAAFVRARRVLGGVGRAAPGAWSRSAPP